MKMRKWLVPTMIAIGGQTAFAGEVGIGNDNNDPDATPPETTTAESCASTLECTWRELLDVFERDTE